jgi:putative heme-binding domain-containing protein
MTAAVMKLEPDDFSRTVCAHDPEGSGAGFQPAAGASSPGSDRGQDAHPGRLEACPTIWIPLLAVWCFLGTWLLALGVSAAPRPAWTSNRVVGSPNPPAPYAVERAFPGIKFDNPVDLAFPPGSERLFVAEQGGKLWTFDTRRPETKPELAIDLRPHHRPFDNILGFTFHPGFATNRFIFINYNEPGERKDGAYVSRFTFSSVNPPTIDPASERVIIRWLSGGHNGCTVAFGDDGFLYLSTGDAASPDPPDVPFKTGQDISDLLSSILRIDVDRADSANAYVVPRDNPFVNMPGARPEVWAFGFRNPWRMSFDRATGDLWVGDVGWEQWEMVYRVQRGGNYGWSITEGPNQNVRTDVKPGPGPILPPMHAVPHSEGASITGGHVYHGAKLPRLRGAYVYGDWETGKFWALRHDGDRLVSNDELCDTTLKPVSFTLDAAGELLVLDYNGGLYQLIPNAAPPANESFPRRLSETGLFSSLNPLTPAPGTVPYRIAAPMWNDHATAEWLLGVPGDGAIVTSGGVGNIAGGTWAFPSNTVLARTLTLEMEPGKPASRRRIETQLLHWDGQAWNPYTFRWDAAQTDAALVPSAGTNDVFTVIDRAAPGGRRETPWRFHSRAECLRCHNAWGGDALTLNWLQLGGSSRREEAHFKSKIDQSLLTSAAAELERLADLGVVRAKNPPERSLALADPYDPALPVADRARSWLHVNCATCHRFGAGGAVAIHLNFDKPVREMRAIDEKPARGDFGLVGARIVAPGAAYRSTLFYRICTEGAGHMPHIGARLADETGARLVFDWIQSMEKKDPPKEDVGSAGRLLELNARLQDQFPRLGRETGVARLELVRDILGSMNGALGLQDLLSQVGGGARKGMKVAGTPDNTFRNRVAALASTHTNALVRDLFQRFLPPDQRRQTLGSEINPQTILALKGDAAHGGELFVGASQCARCHVCGGQGRAFGPALDGVGRKYNRAQLLEQILLPSKLIAPEFKTTTVILRDDTEINGFLLKAVADELVLRDESLAERRIPRRDVRESRESILSAMPEGLLAPLTAQEAADLLEFLFVSEPAAPRSAK